MSDDTPKVAVSGFRDDSLVLQEPARGKDLVELTGHALDRMKARCVSQQDVLDVLRGNTVVVPQENPQRVRLRWRKSAPVTIDLVIEQTSDRVIVVTVVRLDRSPIRRTRR